jgi:hypothetical protein
MPTVKMAAKKIPPVPVIGSSFIMTGEIDLATSMNLKTVIIDEVSGDEPKMSETFCLFTETDSNTHCDEDSNKILINNSDRVEFDPTELKNSLEKDDK